MMNIVFWVALISITAFLTYSKWMNEALVQREAYALSDDYQNEVLNKGQIQEDKYLFDLEIVAVRAEENSLFHTIPSSNQHKRLPSGKRSLEVFPVEAKKPTRDVHHLVA